MPFQKLRLNDGNEAPAIAFGTGTRFYQKDAQEFVALALKSGFSHIDTAQAYLNEESVGLVLRDTNLKRENLYITTKYGGGDIRDSFETSLRKLGIKLVDLYLIHKPYLVESNPEASWREFEKLKDDGLVKSIGVSSYSVSQLQSLLKIARIKPAAHQTRIHPYNWAELKEVVELAAEHGIVTEAYGSLAPLTKTPGGPVDPVLETVGLRIGATPAQVIFKWLSQKNILIVTTTSKKERLEEYLAVADLPNLTDAEVAAIEEAGAKGAPLKEYVNSVKIIRESSLDFRTQEERNYRSSNDVVVYVPIL